MTVMLSGMAVTKSLPVIRGILAMKLAGAFDPVPQMLRRPVMKALAHALRGNPGKLTAAAAATRKNSKHRTEYCYDFQTK